MRERNEGLGILLGMVLLLGLHAIAGCIAFFVILFGTALITKTDPNSSIVPGISALVFTPAALWVYQLLYVVPLILQFKRRRQLGMMKGIIIAAVLTALIGVTCNIALFVSGTQ
jgi:hypothetical protein